MISQQSTSFRLGWGSRSPLIKFFLQVGLSFFLLLQKTLDYHLESRMAEVVKDMRLKTFFSLVAVVGRYKFLYSVHDESGRAENESALLTSVLNNRW
ncbi:hypothetical protein CDAR_467741 [Caerostris darwini]|uniref:Uncharacterized protein n=1 Tax=Caerostris darwini TaxID=1538125 RepID=A0AAV4SLC2_9ARAC|nr:hypothetical protein CDAR_467741 [Caerostris darwini]